MLIIFFWGGDVIFTYLFIKIHSYFFFYRWNANKNISLKYYTYYSVIRCLYDQQLALVFVIDQLSINIRSSNTPYV